MQLRDFLRQEDIFVGLSATSKQQLLRLLAEKAGAASGVPSATLAKALIDRENLGSTGIGAGIAIPHASVAELDTVICMAAKLSKPIDFESVDDVPVDIVIVVLTPTGGKSESLNILSCVARRFREDDITRALRTARTGDEVFALLAG